MVYLFFQIWRNIKKALTTAKESISGINNGISSIADTIRIGITEKTGDMLIKRNAAIIINIPSIGQYA